MISASYFLSRSFRGEHAPILARVAFDPCVMTDALPFAGSPVSRSSTPPKDLPARTGATIPGHANSMRCRFGFTQAHTHYLIGTTSYLSEAGNATCTTSFAVGLLVEPRKFFLSAYTITQER